MEEISPELKDALEKIVKSFIESRMQEEYNLKKLVDKHAASGDLSEFAQGCYNHFYKSMTEANQFTINGLIQVAFIDGMLFASESFPDIINKIVEIAKQQGE